MTNQEGLWDEYVGSGMIWADYSWTWQSWDLLYLLLLRVCPSFSRIRDGE